MSDDDDDFPGNSLIEQGLIGLTLMGGSSGNRGIMRLLASLMAQMGSIIESSKVYDWNNSLSPYIDFIESTRVVLSEVGSGDLNRVEGLAQKALAMIPGGDDDD
ncbi:MAG: hypothetical protein E4G90_00305 [Gemmatimonadales bacterium]|nr:MAG: hypothetical protein E4G90_00305 [Gemmatimonadales bacterium]